jgi:aspartyl-tRNA(Asn)/glutamyl-tRNA(Gln) amidotransferase subunit A
VGFGPEVKRRIMLGTHVLTAGSRETICRKAQRVRRAVAQDFMKAFGEADCIITPTTPSTAFAAGERADDPLTMSMSDLFTVSANLAGLPALTVPCGADARGLPIGLQIIGRRFDEPTVLRVGDAVERMGG